MCLLEGKKVMKKATPQTDKGFIRIATGNSENDILMALAGAKLGGTEISIILCIIRKTWGWSKKEDWISLTQFEKYTKKSRQTIVNEINQLVKKNILVKKTIPGIKTVYSFNKNFSSWEHQLVKKTVPVQKTSTTSKENCTSLVKKTIPTKDTITKETIQKKGGAILFLLMILKQILPTLTLTFPANFIKWTLGYPLTPAVRKPSDLL